MPVVFFASSYVTKKDTNASPWQYHLFWSTSSNHFFDRLWESLCNQLFLVRRKKLPIIHTVLLFRVLISRFGQYDSYDCKATFKNRISQGMCWGFAHNNILHYIVGQSHTHKYSYNRRVTATVGRKHDNDRPRSFRSDLRETHSVKQQSLWAYLVIKFLSPYPRDSQ